MGKQSYKGAKAETERIPQTARRWITPLARFGYAAKGVVYIIIGILAALAATNSGGRTTDSRGALAEILSQPFGTFLLGASTVGLAGYALWRFVQAFEDTENKGSGAKGIAVGFGYVFIGLIYTSLAYSAALMIVNMSESRRVVAAAASREWTARLLAQPFGQWLVGIIGLGVIAFALSQFYKAYTAKFRKKLKKGEMNDGTETLATRAGQIGLSARGTVFAIIGLFLIQAAVQSRASEARGLSGALRALGQQAYGRWVLGTVALGLVVYGLYMFVQARYRRIILEPLHTGGITQMYPARRLNYKRIVAAGLGGAFILSIGALYKTALTQAPDRIAGFREQERKALAEPFVGVTTDGRIVPGLFGIRATGVSTRPVREAAQAFLDGLSAEQRQKTLHPIDDPEWRRWDNRHFPPRQGVGFGELTEQQRQLAFAMLGAGLSARGLQKTQDIMKLNETLAELSDNYEEYGRWHYWITVMGNPSDTEPWGWQLDGHHCIINFFVLGDQIVMTPTFMGSEPVRAHAGKHKGTVVLQDEQDKGLKLFLALDKNQQARAVIRGKKGPSDSLAQAYKDNLVLDYAGIPAPAMSERQQELLLEVIAEYVGNMREGHARVRMDEVRRHLDQTHFAWIGGADPAGVFYYRIQSPVVLIEFDHQSRVAPVRDTTPTRDHIHTVVRTPNGNDYGKDLLRRHLARHPHGARRD